MTKKESYSVTIIEAGPVKITQIKNKEKDGYEAVQIGFLEKRKIFSASSGSSKESKS